MPEPRSYEHGSRIGDLVESLNARLRPYIGGAQLGSRSEAPVPIAVGGGTCPLCGAPMERHEIDRSGPRTLLHCPAG